MQDQKLRTKISNLFGVPIGRTSWKLYFASLNEQGKITARTLLELLTIVLEELDEAESDK